MESGIERATGRKRGGYADRFGARGPQLERTIPRRMAHGQTDRSALFVLILLGLGTWALQAQQPSAPVPDPLIRENHIFKLTDDVFVIPDGNVPLVPNVGVIVGSKGTLVVDTGLGPRNGLAVMHAVSLASSPRALYVISTHFHPEHALGESAFSSTATLIRAQAQQRDIDEFGLSLAETFSKRSPLTADLLRGAEYRKADRLFDKEDTLDLGSVQVRMMALGPAHTRGDTVIFVEPDTVLFAGDIVMNRFLAFASPSSGVKTWVAALDALKPLAPRHVIPSHGDLGDASLIEKNRGYLLSLQARVNELKKQGKSADETASTVTQEFQQKYPEWTNVTAVTPAAKAAYAEAP